MKQRRYVLVVVLGLALAAVPHAGSADPTGTITCPSTVEGWSLMPLDVAGVPSYEIRTGDSVSVNCPYTSDLAYYTSGQYQRDLDLYGNGEFSKPLPPGGQLVPRWALSEDMTAGYCNPPRRFDDITVYSATQAASVTWSADTEPMKPAMRAAAERLLTDVEPLAPACRTETTEAVSVPPAPSGSPGSGAASEPASQEGGGPTDAEILIAAGLIMSILGGVTTFLNLPSRIKRITPGLADAFEVADRVFIPDADPEVIQDIFDEWVTSDPPAPPDVVPPPPPPPPPVVNEPPPLKPSQIPVRPNDLNDPRNTTPTVGHGQFVQWVQQVEAANPDAGWRQVVAGLHGEIYADDLDRTIPGTPVLLFMPGAETAGWQDVRATVSWVYADPSGSHPVARNAPKFVVNPDGTRFDVGHAYAGVRSDLNRHPGETVEDIFRSINTHAGDTWQEWLGAPSESWAQGRPALAHQYAPPDQRLGNDVGIWLSDFYRRPEHANVKLSEAFQKWFQTKVPPSP